MKHQTTSFLILLCLLSWTSLFASVRTEFLLEDGWRFTREDSEAFIQPHFDDSRWQAVRVPHDWAIYGPFSFGNDKQHVAITQDGQTEAMEHAGRTGGLPFVGVGWYRTHFDAPKPEQGKRVQLVFDGAMSQPKVYVNGQWAGEWAYGYNSFHLDITPLLSDDGNNLLAVRLENLPESSRWYPGAGLYRNVHVVITNEAHIPVWGSFVTTPIATSEFAQVNVRTEIELPPHAQAADYCLETILFDAEKNEVGRIKSPLADIIYTDNQINQILSVYQPKRWSPDHPVLYTAESRLFKGNELQDHYVTRFGIRSIELVPDQGFFLNGEKIKFQGVCNHHDLGPLGAAINEAALRRQVRLLKDMGCNAIRTAHNMPAPELLRICDEMGMLVMAESFDEWNRPKCKNGYHLFFDQWVEKDLVNLVRHFRNHPSVVMWCIGNEIPNQGREDGCKTAKWLQDICHREDPTRPVTLGIDNPNAAVGNNFAAVLDVPGFNYRVFRYQQNYRKLPQRLILGSETASTVSSRGVYKFPVERRSMAMYDDQQSSSYDLEHCSWSNLPEDDFIQHEDLPYCMGEFVWTGFDYLGEPTPYYSNWPSHSSLFGIIDLAGLPKDRYWLYRSHWNRQSPTLHVLPHWTWPGREGEVTPVFVYTSYPTAELFINGKSQGKRSKDLSVTLDGSDTPEAQQQLERQKRYRLMWMDTRYEPGTLKVVAYDETGKACAETEVHTAGKPHHIELEADRTQLKADGRDLSFITVKVVDKDGNLCPDATHTIRFKVSGKGQYKAAANGNSTCLESFQAKQMSLFSGQLTAIVETTKEAGLIRFEASSPGLRSAQISLTSSN